MFNSFDKQSNNRIIFKRASKIIPSFLSTRVRISNGHRLFAVTVKDDYLGFNFGQFSITKKLGSAILFYSSKKKKKKINIE